MKVLKLLLFVLMCFPITKVWAQNEPLSELKFEEYLGWVKTFHPVAKQANIVLQQGESNLLRSRGAFDPKVEVDYQRKKFKGTEYYDKLNAVFKIPTWYGIELKAKMDDNSGEYLNPEATVPNDGLYSAGVSFSLAEGLLINDRMAQLKQAKLFKEQSKVERDILVNELLYQASLAYFDCLMAYREVAIYKNFYENAVIRFEAVKKNVRAGDKPAIDSVEANLAVQNRLLGMEQAKLNYTKKSLQLSNFLWWENDTPIVLQPDATPQDIGKDLLDEVFQIDGFALDTFSLESHPKIQSLNYKADILDVERRLKLNKLLPKVSLEYNFYTETPEELNTLNTANYFAGLQVSVPLFLRKERGEYQLAKLKLKDAEYDIVGTEVTLQNKIRESSAEIDSYETQKEVVTDLVANYKRMVEGEERKFSVGESSLFLVNSRETSYIQSQMKANEIENKLFSAQAKLFNILALNF